MAVAGVIGLLVGCQTFPGTASLTVARTAVADGRDAEAESYFVAAIDQGSSRDAYDVRLLEPLAELATLYERRHAYAKAEALLRQALAISEKALGPDDLYLVYFLVRIGLVCHQQANYDDAAVAYRRALAVQESKLGPIHPDLVNTLQHLGRHHSAKGDATGAHSYYQRAAEIRERTSGHNAPELASTLRDLADSYADLGRRTDSEQLLRRALTIEERAFGPDDPKVADALIRLADSIRISGRFTEAEDLYRRALAIREKAFGPRHPKFAEGLSEFAFAYYTLSQYGEAERLYVRALEIQEASLGFMSPDVGKSLTWLANVYTAQGEFARAEPLYERALSITTTVAGPTHPKVATALDSLAALCLARGERSRAESLLARALSIREAGLGPEHPEVAGSLMKLAEILEERGDLAQAAVLLERALAILTKLAPRHWQIEFALDSLANIYSLQGRHADAELKLQEAAKMIEELYGNESPHMVDRYLALADLYRDRVEYSHAEAMYIRSAGLARKVLGDASIATALSVKGLAVVYGRQGRDGDAIPFLREAVSIYERSLGPQAIDLVPHLNDLAYTLRRLGQWTEARTVYERARLLHLRVARQYSMEDESLPRWVKTANHYLVDYLSLLADIAKSAETSRESSRLSASSAAFVVAEQARVGVVARTFARAAAHAAVRAASTTDLGRQQEQLRGRRNALLGQLREVATEATTSFDGSRRQSLGKALANIEQQITEVNDQLYTAMPSYAAIVAPDPLEPQAVAQLLMGDEAVVAFFALEDRLLAWAIRPGHHLEYREVPISKGELGQKVAAVRTTVDQTVNPALISARLTPFDVAGAIELYALLLQPFERTLAGAKHLIIVPGETLLPLPFATLITQKPERGQIARGEVTQSHFVNPEELAGYKTLPWLARTYATTILLSATSLRSLREVRLGMDLGTEPFIGFGDPDLKRPRGPEHGARPPVGNLVEAVQRLPHLPGTRAELLAVARTLDANPDSALYMADRATKQRLRDLSDSGRLAQARVVAFSTHALYAGELPGLDEPALVLTPSTEHHAADDGLLRLSEVLNLRLDRAEWVILSGCQTARADLGGEGLSGLARAFLFAGAPSLLVSHWAIDDRASQALVTEILHRYVTASGTRRSEALRQGMLALLDAASIERGYFSHPFAWAPFFVVGEGAAAGWNAR